MGIFRSKPAAEPVAPVAAPDATEQRFNTASALHDSALAVYHDIADRLVAAHTLYDSLVGDIDSEIDRLYEIRTTAAERAEQAKESARAILDLTRGYRND